MLDNGANNLPPAPELSEQAIELYLDELHSGYLAGDNFQLLAALRFCASQGLEMPRWAADAFQHATDKWYSLQSRTLDEALGIAWPPGEAAQAARKKRREQITVYNKVVEYLDTGYRMDLDLLNEVAARFSLSSDEVADYYYTVKRYFDPESVVAAIGKLLEEQENPGR